MITIKNLIKALKEQGPFKRAWENFIITGNAWGMFSKYSHINRKTGKDKAMYNSKLTANLAAMAMSKKNDVHFSSYKCIFCDGYHIGRNRDNK